MLKVLRHKNISKVIFWFLVVLIMPAFVLWGTGSLGKKGNGPSSVGLINGKKISFDDFSRSIIGIRTQIILNYFSQPNALDIFLKNKAFVGKLAWDRLIMLQEAHKHKFGATDKEVIDFIKFSHPLFQRNGKFDDRIYGYVLRNNIGLEPRTFEEIIRENLTIRKLNDLLTKDIGITEKEVVEAYRRDHEKFKISYLIVPSGDFTAKTTIDDAMVRNYYDKHKDEFVLQATSGTAEKMVAYDEVKEGIRTMLAELEGRALAMKEAALRAAALKNLMETEKLSFDDAAVKLGYTPAQSVLFGKADYLEGIGEAAPVVEAAAALDPANPQAVSNAVATRRGALIFRVTETQKYDEEQFKKDKAEYEKRALELKKTQYIEDWLRELETKTTLNIDLNDYQKYYQQ